MHVNSRIPSTRAALLSVPLLAATLFVGVSSAALAFSPSTDYGENSDNFKEPALVAQQQLEKAGYSQITDVQVLKHGFKAHAVKDGKPVEVEIDPRFGIQQDQ
ncbi:MAG: hypothetical protein JWM77_4337 [Rhodospirillales bacterium]|jgi:hypothetical protein|nr:hypothetical protein [Rhodospirillales bacterium]